MVVHGLRSVVFRRLTMGYSGSCEQLYYRLARLDDSWYGDVLSFYRVQCLRVRQAAMAELEARPCSWPWWLLRAGISSPPVLLIAIVALGVVSYILLLYGLSPVLHDVEEILAASHHTMVCCKGPPAS